MQTPLCAHVDEFIFVSLLTKKRNDEKTDSNQKISTQ